MGVVAGVGDFFYYESKFQIKKNFFGGRGEEEGGVS